MTEKQKEALKAGREKAKAMREGMVRGGDGADGSQDARRGVSKPLDVPFIPEGGSEGSSELMGLMKGLAKSMQGIASVVDGLGKRLNKIETGGRNEFMEKQKPEDVERAAKGREGIDPRTVRLVDEILGEDFAIDIGTFRDKPGFLFTVIVPQRLSDSKMDERPVRDPANPTKYMMRPDGTGFVTEQYFPEDRRSVAISSAQSFDVIRQHCERVRGYIVAYYQKMNRPLPEFKLK